MSIEIEPTTTAKHSVIWLHGLGADGNDFAPIVAELKLADEHAVRFIFPHAPIMPITINNGYEMRAWYDIHSLSLDEKQVDKSGIAKSVAFVNELIAKEEKRGIASEHIILAGFSQGAVIALITGLQCRKPLGGILALSGYLPSSQEVIQNANPINRQIPIFLAHGTDDTIVPYALGKAANLALSNAGFPISWHSYAMPHSVCLLEIRDISQWLQERFNQQ